MVCTMEERRICRYVQSVIRNFASRAISGIIMCCRY